MEVPVDDSGQEGFFGSSSVENFMQNVQKMVQQKIQGEDQPKGLPDAQPINTRALLAADHKKPGIKPMEYVLPPRRRADVLLSVYWKYVHVLYPYLDKPSVQAEYEQLWKGDGSICEERSFVGLLNVIFALSCLLDDSLAAEDREDAARTFYLRARELIDLVENGSIRSVQSFLLLGQYFQSTNASHPCWVFVGTAIRTAQSLGLHLAETSESAPNASARELLRRVWYGCVLMDRVVATTYGRPCMIGPRSATMVPLPMSIIQSPPISGELVEQSDSIDDFIAVEFYILTLKLYEILHDVVFNFYAFNFQIQPLDIDKFCGSLNEGHQSVFEIERRLFRWEQDVPEYLKVPQSQQEEAADTVVRRQAVVLKQRQLHVRLLLLRPVLSYFVTSEFHDGHLPIPLESLLSQRLLLQCAIVCVKVALEAIYIVCAEGSSTVGQMGNVSAWWDCVLYIYTSATILIAARLSPAVLSEISEDLILEGWRKAMAVLERYSCLNPTITRLIATQRLLFEAVPQHYSRHKKNAQQARRNVAGPNCSDSEVLTVPHEEPVGVAANKANSDEARLIGGGQVEESALPSSPFLGWETGFDPDDLSWLMTIPLDC
ncbi:hypothetical protein B0A52_04684 [Exophiala mesophila]|uniref:Xylanolytic transcriptional activator regulatory domain-containing protein n=1 Tax=Exophiala mesophila TaxID=212818 RepID=A0A438N8I7_EXOME|nr:hypothetical protein B0A52_04684 [Exophiala mesophila]